jgi:hypothetical protein
MLKQDAISILNSRASITAPTKYTLKVTNVGSINKVLPNGTIIVGIANFNAMSPEHYAKASELMKAGEYQQACNQNFSASIRSTDYMPTKGEIVDVQIGHVLNREGKEILAVTSITPIRAVSPTAKVDFSSFMDDAVVATADSVAELED